MSNVVKPRVLQDFSGRWELSRQIDHADGTRAQFEGTADWMPDETGMIYAERGHLTMPGQAPFVAERRYLWRDDLSVWFEDGRFFHQVPATGGRAHHDCSPDTYVVMYDFACWPDFSVMWQVTGPRKDYTMRSLYRPIKRSKSAPLRQ